MTIVTVERKVLEKNDQIASENRDLFRKHRVFAVNLVSSPGSGKTSLLERTLEYFSGSVKIAVIEGDVQTDLDARRVARYRVPTVQIVTNGGCHLEANLVRDALANFDLRDIRLLFIENVGNLVCPSNYDLGEALKIVVTSTTEGDDKPLKYPAMFRNAAVLVINKVDLVPYTDCNLAVLRSNALSINPSLKIFETSCRNLAGVPAWCEWLRTASVEALSATTEITSRA